MDYNKLWSLMNKESMSKRGMAKIANMSPAGFNTMMEKKSMTVETLELLANHFGKSIKYFFEEDDPLTEENIQAEEPLVSYSNGCKTCRDKDVEIRLLQKQANEKDEKIYQLQKTVGSLEERLRGGNDSNGNGKMEATG